MDQAFVQHVKAPNDRNGNPRRLYLVTRTGPGSAALTYAVDEGYDNGGDLMRKLRAAGLHVIEIPSIKVSPAQYRRLLQEHGGNGQYIPRESGQ